MHKPNILMTIADDQRASALGCANIESLRTPCLDRLAHRGLRCANAYHWGSPHGAVCAPSRAMLHTGLTYKQIDPGIYATRTPGPLTVPPLLGQKLRNAGYTCFATGKWHNGAETFAASFNAAENVFFGGMADHWFTPVHNFDPTGQYPPDAATTADGFSSEIFARSAADFIRRWAKGPRDQPFFCYCAFTAPHDPRTPPDAYRRTYNPRDIPLPPNFRKQPIFDTASMSTRDEELLGIPRDPNAVKRTIAEYYAMLSHMDACIAEIHRALEETNLAQNTLVVHTADHGLAVGQHGLLGKQNVYEHSIKVPLILAGPGLPANTVTDALCYQHDLHPTLLEFAGVPDPQSSFQSLLPLATGHPGRDVLRSHYITRHRSVRDARYKLIDYIQENRRELYDLREDPWETRNLVDTPAARPDLDRLSTLLQ